MAKTQLSGCQGRTVVGMTSVFWDFTLLSVLCSFLHHREITASIFQVNELALKDGEALGRKGLSFIWEGFNGIWPITAKEKRRGERTKLKQNGAAYKLQAAEMGFTAVTGQTWRYETASTHSGAHPVFTGALSAKAKQPVWEAEYPLQSRAKIKNRWS